MSRVSSKFFEIFPPPKIFNLSSVGIDISDDALRSIEFEGFGKNLKVKTFSDRKFSTIFKDGGKEAQTELVQKLKDLKKDGKFDFAYISIPEDKAYIFKIKIPKTTEGDLNEMIFFQLEENAPISANDAEISYRINKLNSQKDFYEVIVTAIPKEVMGFYRTAFEFSGIVPLNIKMRGQAIVDASITKSDNGTYILVDLGGAKSRLYVVSEGIVQFASVASFGANSTNEKIAKELNISIEKADELKTERGFSRSVDDAKLFSALTNSASIFIEEIRKLYIYWHTHKSTTQAVDKKIEKIVLSGKDACVPLLHEYISSSVKTTVEVINPWKTSFDINDYVPPIVLCESLAYSPAIGSIK